MITDRVEKLLADFRPEHSEFQMENFIIGGGHPWGQYKQALRELSARHGGIASIRAEIASTAAEVERSERWAWVLIGKEKRQLKSALLRSRLKEKRAAYRSRIREYAFFYRIARDMKRQLGEITAKRRRELEAEMWLDKARRMAALDLMTTGGIQRQTAEFLTSLPREQRREIFRDLAPDNRKKLLTILE